MASNQQNNSSIQWLIKTESDLQIGPYATDTILKMISDGTLSGSEQVKRYPDGKWNKISRQPDFYDKLLDALENIKSSQAVRKKIEDYTVYQTTKQQNDEKTEVVTDKILTELAGEEDDIEKTQIVSRNNDSFQSTIPIVDDQKTMIVRKHDIKESQSDATIPDPFLKKKSGTLNKFVFVAFSILVLLAGAILLIDSPTSVSKSKLRLLFPRAATEQTLSAEAIQTNFKKAINEFQKDTFEGYQEAQNKLVATIEGAPKNIDARGTLCLVYKELWPFVQQDAQDLESVFNMAKATRSLDPTGINSVYCETIKLMILGKTKEARGVVEFALNQPQFSTAPVLYSIKSELLAIEGDFKTAVLYSEKAKQLWPEWTKPVFDSASYYLEQGQSSEAIKNYQSILAGIPTHKKSQIKVGVIYYKNFRKADQALNYLSSAVVSPLKVTNVELAQAHFYLALIFADRKDSSQAKENAKKAFLLNPSDANIKELYANLGGSADVQNSKAGQSELMFLGDQHQRTGNCLAAQAEFKAAFEIDQTFGLAAMKAAQCLWQMNQASEAIQWLKKAISADAKLVSANVLLADYLSQRNDYVGAVQALNKIATTNPNNHEILRGFGLIEYRRNNMKDAIGFLTRANKIYENDIETLILLAKASAATGDFTAAQKYSVRAIEIDSTDSEAQIVYAQVLTQFQGLDAGILYLKELIKKFSYTLQYRMALADLYRSQEKSSEAQLIYQQILQVEPKNKQALLGLGQCYQDQGVFDKALRTYLSASIYDPSDAEGLMRAGLLYMDSQKYADAINQFKRAQSVNPLYPRINYYIGKAQFYIGEFEAALGAAMQERKLNPNLADSYILAAEIYSSARQYQKCASEYQLAIKLRPQGADLYVKLAKCYRQSGSPDIAESMLSIAAGQESGLADIYKEQGAVYEAKGDARAAVQAYDKYLTLSPNAPDKQEIENRILNLGK